TGLRHRHVLARSHRRDDEIGLRRQLGMRGRQRHTDTGRMLAQRPGTIVTELDVVSRDAHAVLAQILGEDPADLAIADQPDMQLIGGSHRDTQSIYLSPAFASGSRILYMSRPSTPSASFWRFSPSLASRAAAASAA